MVICDEVYKIQPMWMIETTRGHESWEEKKNIIVSFR